MKIELTEEQEIDLVIDTLKYDYDALCPTKKERKAIRRVLKLYMEPDAYWEWDDTRHPEPIVEVATDEPTEALVEAVEAPARIAVGTLVRMLPSALCMSAANLKAGDVRAIEVDDGNKWCPYFINSICFSDDEFEVIEQPVVLQVGDVVKVASNLDWDSNTTLGQTGVVVALRQEGSEGGRIAVDLKNHTTEGYEKPQRYRWWITPKALTLTNRPYN